MEKDYNAIIEQNIADMIEAIKRRIEPEDINRIKEAFSLAKEAHKKQFRKSGEPYILHPIAVARIIAEELELGANPIMAAFLHDVVEDTDYTIEDIRNLFGDDVAFLVGVVTKRKKDHSLGHSALQPHRQFHPRQLSGCGKKLGESHK